MSAAAPAGAPGRGPDGAPRSIVVGTAGHIDHGKSSLVKALTGTDPDRLKEEKARGITIELGFAHAALDPDTVVSFVDVPGHERFVRTMLAGAGGIDAVLLVIAADESVMPQTREHFDICRLLDVRRGAIVLTKADAVDADTLELAAIEARELVAGSFLAGAPVVPVSSLTGAGLEQLREVLRALVAQTPPRPRSGVARLPVDRAFTMRGFGTVVTGTLSGGTIAVDDSLELLPGRRPVKVRGVQVHGQPRAAAHAGERAALNLAGVDVEAVARGAIVAPAGALVETRRIDAEITVLPGAALKHGARVRVHQGTSEVLGRLSIAGRDAVTTGDGPALVRLRLERPIVLARRDRVILRTYSPLATVGGGVVLDPDPPRSGVRTAKGVERVAALRLQADASLDATHAIRAMAASAGSGGVTIGSLAQRLGLPIAIVDAAVGALDEAGLVVAAGGAAVARAVVGPAVDAMLEGLSEHHVRQPLSPGLPRDEVRGRWFAHTPIAIVERLLGEASRAGRIVVRDVVALSSHRVALSGDDQALAERLERALETAALQPPEPAALAGALGAAPAQIDRVLPLLVKQRRLVRLDTLVFHPAALDRLKAETMALKASAAQGRATIDVKTFKDRYGVSRKYAIPLLEYLDRERVTRRMGDVRLVL